MDQVWVATDWCMRRSRGGWRLRLGAREGRLGACWNDRSGWVQAVYVTGHRKSFIPFSERLRYELAW